MRGAKFSGIALLVAMAALTLACIAHRHYKIPRMEAFVSVGDQPAANVQVSYLLLIGNFDFVIESFNAAATFRFGTNISENFLGHGFSGLLSLIYVFHGNAFFYLSYRVQVYKMQVTAVAYTLTNKLTGAIEAQHTNKNHSIVDGATDFLTGVSAGVMFRLF